MIDAVGRSRGAGLGGGNDEREQTLNQILSEMDGFEPHEDVVVLAATNRPDVLDQALLRPGRFDRKVYLELPDRKARRAILKIHAKKVRLADDVDLERIAGRTTGFSGADFENLVNEAALLAGRHHREQVDMDLLARARDKIALGAEREQAIGDDERRLIAVHESGHALLAWLLPHAEPLDKVTIIPRSQALGVTEQVPQEERHTYTQSYLRDRIGVMLGGRIAEQLVFGEVTALRTIVIADPVGAIGVGDVDLDGDDVRRIGQVQLLHVLVDNFGIVPVVEIGRKRCEPERRKQRVLDGPPERAFCLGERRENKFDLHGRGASPADDGPNRIDVTRSPLR